MTSNKMLMKIWTLDRQKKCFVCVTGETGELLNETITKASQKLGITGHELVLESDGTTVDDDDVLPMVKSETLILLEEGETWHAVNCAQQFIPFNKCPPKKVSSTEVRIASPVVLQPEQLPPIRSNIIDSFMTYSAEVSPLQRPMVELATDQEHNDIEAGDELLTPKIETMLNDMAEDENDNMADVEGSSSMLLSEPVTTSNFGSFSARSQEVSFSFFEQLTWTNFDLPWNKIPHYMLDQCAQGIRTKRTLTTIIHTVVDAMRDIKTTISCKSFRIVAQKMVDVYPLMFRDVDDDGVTIGYGLTTLHFKLQDRNNYLNRLYKMDQESGGNGSRLKKRKWPGKDRVDLRRRKNRIPNDNPIMDPAGQVCSATINDVNYFVAPPDNIVWMDFEIPWSKIPPKVVGECVSATMNKRTVAVIVHKVVDAIREVSANVPSRALKIAAQKIIDAYPIAFRDIDDDGVILGDGFTSLYLKLQDRYNYVNRAYIRSKPVDMTPEQQESSSYSSRQELMLQLQDTMSILNSSESPAVIDYDDSFHDPSSSADDVFYQMMETTYAAQRNYINQKGVKIEEMRQKWPILFEPKSISWHFNKFTRSNINALDHQIEMKYEKIWKFAETNDKLKCETKETCRDDKLVQILQIFASYFVEEIGSFYVTNDEIGEVPTIMRNSGVCIVKVPGVKIESEFKMENPARYCVYLDQQVLHTEGYATFVEAFKLAFASFFVFNIKYPKLLAVTLEMMQRYFFKLHPDVASQKMSVPKRKIIPLINKLKCIS